MEMGVIVSENKHNEYGGNSEPYKGFFSDKGLLYKKREFAGFRSYSQRLSLVRPTRQFEDEISGAEMLEVWPRVVYERGFYVQTPDDLGLEIFHDEQGRGRSIYDNGGKKKISVNSINELLQLENSGMPTEEAVERVVKPYREAGCKPWYGAMLTVVTGSSIQHVELGVEGRDIRYSLLLLESLVLKKAKKVCGALDEQRVEQFYGPAFDAQMRADLGVDEEKDPFDDPEKFVKLLGLLPGVMLRNHNRAAKKAGFLAADKELYKFVKKYCKDYSLPVAYQDQGKSIQKWLLKEKLEGREHFVACGTPMPGPSREELRQLPLEELERIKIDGPDWHEED